MKWLLVRGLTRERRHWHEFPRLLAEHSPLARIELLDLPGAGTEAGRLPLPSVSWMARDIARRWRPAEPGQEAVWGLVGLSLGGMVALELCRLFPRRFARAVIINASSRLTAPLGRLQPRAALVLLRAALTADPLLRERRVLDLTSTLPAAERARYARLSAEVARETPVARRTLVAQLLAAARFLPPAPSAIDARLAFVCSRGDAVVNPRCSHDLAAWYGSPCEEHPSAGHDLPLDDPVWLCERIMTFAAARN
jgi:pimeloyl-ACP methyl ester carboxylesterase